MYYPKSQIITNLYTNGEELVFLNNQTQYYQGYYHTISTGQIFSGKNPNDGIPQPLIFPAATAKETTFIDLGTQSGEDDLYIENTLSLEYDDIRSSNNIPPSPASLIEPKYVPASPSFPAFTRYFVKKTNELRYIEIDKLTFDKIVSKDKQYNWASYKPFTIYWTTAGSSIQSVEQINKNIVILEEKRQKLYGLTNYFKNYSEFYR
jgi:hypothetical protein